MNEKLVIYADIDVSTQDALFKFISKKAQEHGVVLNQQDFLKALYEREKVGTTGLENHIAIPHAISDKVLKQFVFVICLKKAIKYTTLDGTDVKSVICLAVPKAKENMHLDVLQKVSIMLLDKKNQDILNDAKIEKIETLFTDVKKEIKSKSNVKNKTNTKTQKIIETANDVSNLEEDETVEPKPVSLISIKKELKSEYDESKTQECLNRISENNKQIISTKKEIISLRKNLRNNNVTIKSKFKKEFDAIKIAIKAEKEITKKALNEFNAKDKLAINKIKETITDDKLQREALGKHFTNTYQAKIAISEKLTNLETKKETLQTEYKLNKKNSTNDFQAKLNFDKQLITNPKNYFYKHINKYQLALMILLAIVGLWGIVLGSFGTTINQNFVVLNIDQINTIFSKIAPGMNYESVYLAWSQQTVQSAHYTTSLCSFIFGIIAIALIVPLKFFKVSNVYLENYSWVIFGFSVVCLIVITVLAALSFDNIDLYQSAATFATGKSPTEGLNTQLKAYWDLQGGLKQLSDFNDKDNDFNNYKTNIQILLENWTGSDIFDESNRALAIGKITTAIKTTMDSILPTQNIAINNDLIIMGSSLMMKI